MKLPVLVVVLGLLAPFGPAGARAAAQVEGSARATQVSEEPPAPPAEGADFLVFRADGTPASLPDVLAALDGVDVLLVGEEHGNRVGHGVEAMLFEGALRRFEHGSRWVTLSMEMFERDVQYVVDEYLAGLISEVHFLDSARPWEEYRIRYRPLVEMARAWGSPIVAANAPRRYVNMVTRGGPEALDQLGELARFYLPPLPYPGPSAAYRAQWDALMAEAMGLEPGVQGTPEGRTYAGSENALQAQALWDAAMGHAIAEAFAVSADRLVVHFAGSFHVERGTGIAERIEDYRPGTRVLSVVMTRVEDDALAWDATKHAGLGDFVILTR